MLGSGKEASSEAKELAEMMQALILSAPSFKELKKKDRRRLLATLHPDSLLTLAEHELKNKRGITDDPHLLITGYQGSGPAYMNHYESPLRDVVNYCITNGSFTPINDMAAYVEDHELKMSLYSFLPYLTGLQPPRTPTLGAPPVLKPYSEADAVERRVIHAVLEATMTAKTGDVRFIEDENGLFVSRRLTFDLMSYIADNPDNGLVIMDIIDRRGIDTGVAKYDDYVGIMNERKNIAVPLADGAL